MTIEHCVELPEKIVTTVNAIDEYIDATENVNEALRGWIMDRYGNVEAFEYCYDTMHDEITIKNIEWSEVQL